MDTTLGNTRFGRRTLIKVGVGGGLAAFGLGTALRSGGASAGENLYVGLAATDGWISLPIGAGGVSAQPPFFPDALAEDPDRTVYSFGFREVTTFNQDFRRIIRLKGQVQHTAPILYRGLLGAGSTTWKDFQVGDRIQIELWNIGLAVRPDLADGHTIHWHGFPNQIPYFDGVPETSIAVPAGRSFIYEFVPNEPGTYMYHCHFEDVEHVQMGMTGVVFVRPGDYDAATNKTAYGAGTESEFDREYTFMLTEIDLEEHWLSAHIQQPDWSEYRPDVFMMNGRTYPDTLEPSTDPLSNPFLPPGGRLAYQPTSSLIQGNAGEKVLLRIANLGFNSHSMELSGLPMHVVGMDAKSLSAGRAGYASGAGNFDTGPRSSGVFETNTLDVAPGRSFDVIVQLPDEPGIYPFAARGITGSGDAAGGGSMRTELRVVTGLGPQSAPNDVVEAP